MNQQVYLAGLVFLSVAVVFLFYQNIKMERKYNKEIQFLNSSIKEVTQMIALNNDISIDNNTNDNTNNPIETASFSMPSPQVSENLQQEMSNLMEDYSSYNEDQNLTLTVDNEPIKTLDENGDKYDSISEELKKEIENLEKRDSSSENLDEELENEELENDDIQEINLDDNDNYNDNDNDENTINEEMLGELNSEIRTEAGTFKNMVDEIIATASEAENNLESEGSDGKNKWDGNVENTPEGMFLVLENERKMVDSLSVKELTFVCKLSGLKTKGKKSDLIERFKEYNTQKKNTFFLESN